MIRYWGEGHVLDSPANVRDMWKQIYAWFDEHLKKPPNCILRHADVSTTQAFYILPNRERAEAELKKLDKTLRTKYGIKA